MKLNFNLEKKLLLVIPLIISGCDSDAINKVKNTIPYGVDNSLNIGDAFKTRSDCNNGKWSDNKDSRGRHIVSYTCSIGSNGTSEINQYLLRYPTSWELRQEKNYEYLIDSSEKDILDTKKSIGIINDQKKIVNIYIDKLYSAFTYDNLISEKLYFSSYLENMLSLMRPNLRVTSDILCHENNYINDVDYNSSGYEIDPKYVQDSCIKNIYPVFKGFEKDIKPNLDASEGLDASDGLYDFYSELNNSVGQGYSIEDQKEAINEYFNKYIVSHEESQRNITKSIPIMKGKIESLKKQLLSLKNEIQVNNVSINYQWMVSNTGTVDYLGARIVFDYHDIEKSIFMNNYSFIAYAYQDFRNGDIPDIYAVEIFDSLRYIIEEKQSLFEQ